jgi:hypothetical protein
MFRTANTYRPKQFLNPETCTGDTMQSHISGLPLVYSWPSDNAFEAPPARHGRSSEGIDFGNLKKTGGLDRPGRKRFSVEEIRKAPGFKNKNE